MRIMLDFKKKRYEKKHNRQIQPTNDSTNDEEEREEENEYDEIVIAVIEPENNEAPAATRSGRRCTTYKNRHFYGDSD